MAFTKDGTSTTATATIQADTDALQVDTASIISKVDADKAVDDLGATAAALTTVGSNVTTALTRIGTPATSLTVDVAAVKSVVDAGATAAALTTTDAKIGTPVNTGGTATLSALLGDYLGNSAAAYDIAINNSIGSPVNTGGNPTLSDIVGDPANVSLAARLIAVEADTTVIGSPAGASVSADIAAVQTDVGDASTAWPTLPSLVAYLGSLPDLSNAPLGTLAVYGFQLFKISAVTSDTSFTIAAAATGAPTIVGETNHYANQIIWKIGGSAPVSVAGIITASTAGGVLTLSGAGLISATMGDRVLVMQRPSQVGISGDQTSATLPSVHGKLGLWSDAATYRSTTGSSFSKHAGTHALVGAFDGQTNFKSLYQTLINAANPFDTNSIALIKLAMYGAVRLYVTSATGNGVITINAVGGGGAPVPDVADALRGAWIVPIAGTHVGKIARIHSYTTAGVCRHTLTTTSFGSSLACFVILPLGQGARRTTTWHPWDLPAVMVTQATDIAVPDQAVAVTQTTLSATYVILEKKTYTAADCPLPNDWIKANRLVWTSDMSNAGTGATKWMISPESATETVNSAPSGSAVAISDEQAAAAAATTHYLNAISPVPTAAIPANGGFHLLLCGKGDGAETLTCTVFASSYLTIG